MTPEEVKILMDNAKKVTQEAAAKFLEVDGAMKQLRAFKEEIDKGMRGLNARRAAVEEMEKRIQYARLRIKKLISDKSLDKGVVEILEGIEKCQEK